MESNAERPAFTAFDRLFKERGLPRTIRSDNGLPFASPNGLFNLSKLSVWWLRLGISAERIKPGHNDCPAFFPGSTRPKPSAVKSLNCIGMASTAVDWGGGKTSRRPLSNATFP